VLIRLRQLLRPGRGQEGSAAVEFAIILPLLILLILGGMDLAHMFYIEHIVTTASREGARYAAKYTVSPRVDPTVAEIKTFVISKLLTPLDGLDVPSATYAPGTGVPPGRVVTVTVTAPKTWWILATFNFYDWVPFPNPQTMTGTTTMKVEE
jgi:Flp pilus assembly protein TadG